MKLSKKKILTYLATVALALVLTVTAVFGYAYFSKKEIYDGYLSGKVELLFDRLDENGIAAYGTAEGVTADMDAEWGTKENPYVISNVRHLYNLSELQNIGYFYKQFIKPKEDETENTTRMPYFLVCDPDYTPVVIDGSQFKEITAIGNDDYPFIGSVKGVFNESETVTIGGVTSATSTIHNVTVKGNPTMVDVGLFGYVGFLGTPPAEGSTDTTFNGTPSVLSDLVLSDIKIKVDSSAWDKITEFVKDIAIDGGRHRYSFTELYGVKDSGGNDIYNTVPHENHHIGILAGHVSYSIVEYISVYYSNDNIVAIDLKDGRVSTTGENANYMSATGIIGFLYNLNPSYDEGSSSITAGSGKDVADLSYSMVGGGGDKVGEKAGYILARNIYNAYKYIGENSPPDTSGTIKISTATKADGTPLTHSSTRDMGILGTQTGYYFADGVFTFALSTQNDVIEPTWKNNEIDQFQIGSTNRNNWVTNYTKGNKAVAAYISAITNDEQLRAAEDAGKPILILREKDIENIFLMSLYNQSTSLGNDWDGFASNYTTNGAPLKYGDQEFIDSLVQSYDSGNSPEFLEGFEAYGTNVDKNAAANTIMGNLESGTEGWRVINVGMDSNSISIQTLRDQYKIIPKTESYLCYDEKGNQVVHNENFTISEYYDYNDSTYTGFFYYTTFKNVWGSTKYKYYWVGKDGTTAEWGTGTLDGLFGGENAPNSFFNSTSNGAWNGENVYTKGDYTGILLNAINAPTYTFYGTNNAATRNGTNVTKPVGEFQFFYRPAGEGDTYYYRNSDGTISSYTRNQLQSTGTTTPISGLTIYTSGDGKTGVLIDRYNYFSFSSSNGQNSMRLVYANYYGVYSGSTIWNGSDSAAQNAGNFKMIGISPGELRTNKNALAVFNADGSCNIRYTNEKEELYITYNPNLGTNGGVFNGSTSTTENTRLRLYVLEATQDINYGRVTFDPANGTGGFEFNANEHVLYTTTDGNGNTFYEVMDVTKLPNLGNENALGWKSGDAADESDGVLTGSHLMKKFHTEKGIQFGAVLNIGGYQLGTSGLVTAPVGAAGINADIPLGCVAFRVNKTGIQHVRVIISVSVSEYYVGETDASGNKLNTLGESRRYFNMWKINESGSETLNMFTKNEAFERFEIPISNPYEPGTSATDTSSDQGFYTVKYDSNADGTAEDYGMFMNGDRILVAYEFTVDEVGLYILGPSGFNNDAQTGIMSNFEGPDVPMEIVYFSADGVASSGRDGASASQIGTIDYVYSFGGEIITVTDESETDNNGTEDYNTYYPSYVLTYFENTKKVDGKFVVVNNELMGVHRYVAETPTSSEGYNTTKSYSTIKFTVGRDKHGNIIQYARFSDNVIKEEE